MSALSFFCSSTGGPCFEITSSVTAFTRSWEARGSLNLKVLQKKVAKYADTTYSEKDFGKD
jgi:hypothetical protein